MGLRCYVEFWGAINDKYKIKLWFSCWGCFLTCNYQGWHHSDVIVKKSMFRKLGPKKMSLAAVNRGSSNANNPENAWLFSGNPSKLSIQFVVFFHSPLKKWVGGIWWPLVNGCPSQMVDFVLLGETPWVTHILAVELFLVLEIQGGTSPLQCQVSPPNKWPAWLRPVMAMEWK